VGAPATAPSTIVLGVTSRRVSGTRWAQESASKVFLRAIVRARTARADCAMLSGSRLPDLATATMVSAKCAASLSARWVKPVRSDNSSRASDITSTSKHSPPLGGSRPWFQCACGRRVGVLFDASSGFYCRTCLRLTYACQHVTKSWRLIDRAQAIKVRLGGSANLLDEFPERPRYMPRKRYEILRKTALLLQAEGLGVLDHSLERGLRRATRRAARS
jgi:hypothetical protein